jgi:hypothetical protein
MSHPLAYWDSSALVPLCVPQVQTPGAISMYERFQVVAWWASEVEIVSALARLERMGQISRSQFIQGKQRAQEIVRDWISADSKAGLVAQACTLLELHTLRAADALQLAVALAVCDQRPKGFLFVTSDQRLADAAGQSGFSIEFL